MSVATVIAKNTLATAYSTGVGKYGALSTTAPGATAGTEVTGGSPAYARIAPVWGTASGGAISASALPFNVPASTTVQGYEHYDAATAGNYLDGGSVTPQTFASQGTYSVTPTYTQS